MIKVTLQRTIQVVQKLNAPSPVKFRVLESCCAVLGLCALMTRVNPVNEQPRENEVVPPHKIGDNQCSLSTTHEAKATISTYGFLDTLRTFSNIHTCCKLLRLAQFSTNPSNESLSSKPSPQTHDLVIRELKSDGRHHQLRSPDTSIRQWLHHSLNPLPAFLLTASRKRTRSTSNLKPESYPLNQASCPRGHQILQYQVNEGPRPSSRGNRTGRGRRILPGLP